MPRGFGGVGVLESACFGEFGVVDYDCVLGTCARSAAVSAVEDGAFKRDHDAQVRALARSSKSRCVKLVSFCLSGAMAL